MNSKAESLILDKHVSILTRELSSVSRHRKYKYEDLKEATNKILSDDRMKELQEEMDNKSGNSSNSDRRNEYKIPENLMSKLYIQQTVESNLAENGLPASTIKQISDEVSQAVANVMKDRLNEIEDAIESQDQSKLRTVSKMILTAIVGQFIDEAFDIMTQYSDQIMRAIVETIGSAI